jgi:Na+-transporting NADH:ubiquinone oxidoreductase subunit NqrE
MKNTKHNEKWNEIFLQQFIIVCTFLACSTGSKSITVKTIEPAVTVMMTVSAILNCCASATAPQIYQHL